MDHASPRSGSEKSTTVRSLPLAVRALRVWFAVESRVAPGLAERRAARMFVTPPRQRTPATKAPERRRGVDGGSPVQHLDIVTGDETQRIAAAVIGEGPNVMLVHGWGGSSADMIPLAEAFAAAGYRSVLFDMPGHGRSSGRESSLVEFLRAMGVVSTTLGVPDIIVGHSFGGAAAVFGITELGLPIRGAVLVAPAPGPAYYVERFVRAVGLPPERTRGMMRHVVERVGRTPESLDALTVVPSVRVPGVIFHDPRDREVPFEFAEQMTGAWEASRLVPMPGRGHKRILRDAEVIAAAVEFARMVGGGR